MGPLKTAATVAVASSVHGRIQRRQQARWAAGTRPRGGQPAPPPAQYAAPAQPQQAYAEPSRRRRHQPRSAAGRDEDRLAQLKQLGELLSAGVLTQAEFDQQKARILNG